MSDIYFKCECGKSLAVHEAGIGRAVSCVDCGTPVIVPEPDLEFACEGCGATLLAPLSISGDRIKCTSCGHRMRAPSVIESNVGARSRICGSAPSSPLTSTAPCRVMDSIMRSRNCLREGGHVARRRRGAWERISPNLTIWLLRAAAAFAVLILAREFMRCVSREDMTEGEALVMSSRKEQQADTQIGIVSGTTAQEEPVEPYPMSVSAPDPAVLGAVAQPAMPEIKMCARPEAGIKLSVPFAVIDSVPPPSEAVLSESEDSAAKLAEAPSAASEELRLLRERAAAMPPCEEQYRLLDEIFFKEQPPALQALHLESQKLLRPIYGLNREEMPQDQLKKCDELFSEYNKTHPGKSCDGHFWFSAGLLIRGCAIRAAKDYREAEDILRKTWLELDVLDPGAAPSAARLKLAVGMELAQAWVAKNTLEVSKLFGELETMATGADREKMRDIWGPNARSLRTRFMKYAENVPDDQRAEFMARQRQQLEKHLLDDSAPKRNRAAALRGWITLLDKQGSLTDALPLIEQWQEKYAGEPLDMNYLFSRIWVELYGEGDWDKAEKTMLLATREARDGERFLDKSDYAEVINLFYELQFQPGYELQRRRTIRQKGEAQDTWQTASSKGRRK